MLVREREGEGARARERHGIDLCLRRGGGLSAVSYILIFSWRVEANCFGSCCSAAAVMKQGVGRRAVEINTATMPRISLDYQRNPSIDPPARLVPWMHNTVRSAVK